MEQRLASLLEATGRLARGVFDELAPGLEPNVVLVAFPPAAAAAEAGAVRVAAPRGGYSAAELGQAWLAARGEGEGEGDEGERLRRRAIQAVATPVDRERGLVSFVSTARPWARHDVHVVLQLDRETYGSYHTLRRRASAAGVPLARSLLDAAVTAFLEAATATIAEATGRGPPPVLPRSPDEILRSAGRTLIETAALAAGGGAPAYGFFQLCHRISSMHYEGHEGSGQMIVAAPEHPNVHLELLFHDHVDLHDHRAVRKVLELTGQGLALVTDSSELHGLGRVVGSYDRATESLFEVWFRSHAAWELLHADAVLMSVVDGNPRLPHWDLDEDEFRSLLGEIFDPAHPANLPALWNIAIQAAHQRRGTMVVISARAAEEAARLGPQAIRLVPVLLTPDRVPMLTAIDGAVLVDPDGHCHAVGVILDGRASRRGDPARGARFNSAVRYVDAAGHPCVAIVISEEGGVDLIGPLV
jgi:hypothetical protein